MSKPQNLRRLLSHQQIQSWLKTIVAYDNKLKIAIVEPNNRLFAQAGSWDEGQLADLAVQSTSITFQFPIEYQDVPIGVLFVDGPDRSQVEIVADFVHQAIVMLVNEAAEKRGLAIETLDRYREINLLYRIGETIGAAVEPSAIASMILEEGHQIINADFGLVLLEDNQSDWVKVAEFGHPLSSADVSTLISLITSNEESKNRPAILTDFPEMNLAGNGAVVRTLLWAPLSTTEKILGGVLFGRIGDQPMFIANDQKLLVALAGQAAIALDKANLFEETRASANHLRELNAIGRDLAVLLDLDSLLRRILRAAIDLTNCVEGAFFLVEEPSKDLIFNVIEGGTHEKEIVGLRLPSGTGIVGRVASTGRPQIVNNAQENKYWFDGIDKLKDYATRSILAVPLLKQDEAIGVLEVINRKDGRPFRQQDMERLSALASQAVVAMETCRLHQAELAKQRMERELQLGHSMQASLIPASIPDLPGWEFAAWWEPAREVSGDFYDFIQLDDGLGVVVADVADKGVQAALFMSLTRSTVRTCLHALESPAEGISEANRLIAQDASRGMFVTLTYAHFRPNSGEITYVNAGHNPPLWYHTGQGDFTELETTGIFLGFESDIPYEAETIHCRPGDVIVFYTDGVTEAMNAHRELFGEARFQLEISRAGHESPEQILKHLLEALAGFVEDTPQSDDITIVIAKCI